MEKKTATPPITFLMAVEEKFCEIDTNELDSIQLSNELTSLLNTRTKDHTSKEYLTLDGAGISSAGLPGELRETCPNLKELDLSHNSISCWKEIFSMIIQLPRLRFLNLSHNPLGNAFDPGHYDIDKEQLPPIQKLALSKTGISIESTAKILTFLPSVEELHLSLNDFGCIGEVESTATVQQLYCANSNISSWQEVNKLGKLFPRLHSLVVSENPLSNIELEAEHFSMLTSLSLCQSDIDNWETVDHLNDFPKLTMLRISNIPLLEDLPEKKRRQLLVARLPKIEKLNGSPVELEEREKAERVLIRHYMNHQQQPERYHQLVDVHGALDNLVEIDFTPRQFAHVDVIFQNAAPVHMKLNLQMTTQELKDKLMERFQVTSSNARLYYIDQEAVKIIGREEMRIPNTKLYRFNINDGDQIQMELFKKYQFKSRKLKP